MKAQKEILFEKCPLCCQAEISKGRRPGFFFSKSKSDPCPKCSAEFVEERDDRYKLIFCEPHKILGSHSCSQRIFRGCYLDLILSRSEWQRIAEGKEPNDLDQFLGRGAEYSKGRLPSLPPHQAPFILENDEVIHYISSPVYLCEKKSSKADTSDKGDFFLTNKRIVFVRPSGRLVISLNNIEEVGDHPPGFLVKEKGSFIPHVFFPPKFDPAFAAVCGAIHNFKVKV